MSDTPKPPRLVVIESPYSGDVETNVAYLHRCIRDCVMRHESPYASHLMLTTALDDSDPDQRDLGLAAGWAWYGAADAAVVYVDRGISDGMWAGIEAAVRADTRVELRTLDGLPMEAMAGHITTVAQRTRHLMPTWYPVVT